MIDALEIHQISQRVRLHVGVEPHEVVIVGCFPRFFETICLEIIFRQVLQLVNVFKSFLFVSGIFRQPRKSSH